MPYDANRLYEFISQGADLAIHSASDKAEDCTAKIRFIGETVKKIIESPKTPEKYPEPELISMMRKSADSASIYPAQWSLDMPIKKGLACICRNSYLMEAKQLVDDGNIRVAVMDFSNPFETADGISVFGGSFNGERLLLCSTLYPALFPVQYLCFRADIAIHDVLKEGYKKRLIPANILHLPDIRVLRNEETLEFLEAPYDIDVLACVSPDMERHPYQEMDDEKREEYKDDVMGYVRNVFGVALDSKNEAIVIGLSDGGNFTAEYAILAKMFANIIKKYGGSFKEIVFAIRPGDEELAACFEVEFENLGILKRNDP